MIVTLSPRTEQDDVDSYKSVTLEWIQTLPQELKDEALLRLCKTVESKPTLVETFTLNQVLYRTISGGTFTESADNVATRTGCDRKTILKGLAIAKEQNILEENKRPGTSNEYWFKPVEEWLPEPVCIKDTRTKKVREFPSTQNTESVENNGTPLDGNDGVMVVLNTDDRETDTNTVVVINNSLKQQQEVEVRETDTLTSSHWKYVGQGLPRVYMPPDLDQETGKKIESIHETTKRPRSGIIKEAIDLLHSRLNRIPTVLTEKRSSMTQAAVIAINPVIMQCSPVDPTLSFSYTATDEALTEAMKELRRLRIEDNVTVRSMVKKLWPNFQGAYASIKQRIERNEPFVNITGAFINALKNGDKPEVTMPVEQMLAPTHSIDEPNSEEMALIDDAISTGRAKDKYCGSRGWLVIENNGQVAPWQQFLAIQIALQRHDGTYCGTNSNQR